MYYQKEKYFTGDKIKIFRLKDAELNEKRAIYLITALKKAFHNFSWGSMFGEKFLNSVKVQIPTRNNEIDFSFMESTICALEAERLELLEAERLELLEAYLISTNLHDYHLTPEEEKILREFEEVEWEMFNLKELFGSSTRGRRLKSADRISGNLPFVTAGEAETGVSAFIGNDVNVFSKNTITI